MPQQKMIAVLERRVKVAHLHAQGYSQDEIAAMIGVTQPCISQDLTRIEQMWQKATVQDAGIIIARACATYTLVRKEAWAGWERSKALKETTITEAVEGGSKAETARRKASVRKESQVGDPAFFSPIIHAQEAETTLLGVAPPTKIKLDLEALTADQLLRIAQGEPAERVLAPSPALPLPLPTIHPNDWVQA